MLNELFGKNESLIGIQVGCVHLKTKEFSFAAVIYCMTKMKIIMAIAKYHSRVNWNINGVWELKMSGLHWTS